MNPKTDSSAYDRADDQYAFFCRTRKLFLRGQSGASFAIVALTWNFAHQQTLIAYLVTHQILVLISAWVYYSEYTNANRTPDGLPKFAYEVSMIRQLFLGWLLWLDLSAAENLTFVLAVLVALCACVVGSVVVQGPIRRISQLSITCFILPSAIACLYVGHYLLGGCLLYFMYVVAFRAARELGLAYEELMRLRGQSAEAARGLEKSNRELVTANASLEAEVAQRIQAEAERSKLQKELVWTSRQAGRAEIASGVLHNIGNVMNSVNVSTAILQEDFETGLLKRLNSCAELLSAQEDLGEFFTNDERSQHLLPYLKQITARASEMKDDFETILTLIERVDEVVASQQFYATGVTLAVEANPVELVELSLQVTEDRRRAMDIAVETDFGFDGNWIFDRSKLLQVLVNLLNNACDSIEDSGKKQQKITVAVNALDEQLEISVSDSGIGIPKENLQRIFQNGFCGRPKPARPDSDRQGFGLHHSINSLRESGGDLLVESSGEMQGATFTIVIPQKIAPAPSRNDSYPRIGEGRTAPDMAAEL